MRKKSKFIEMFERVAPVSYEKCILSCSKPQFARGLCKSCYFAALAQVRKGNTTWQQLESLKLSKPFKGRGKAKPKVRPISLHELMQSSGYREW